MKFYAINGSPRKTKNTATILQYALDGAKSVSTAPPIETEMVHLHSLNFSSFVSCFECKKLGGKSYARCALQDELSPLLAKLLQADGIILGSPIYFGGITGKMVCFLERLFFPVFTYDVDYATIAPKRMPTSCIYTMNVSTRDMHDFGYPERLAMTESYLERVFTKPRVLYVNNTYQFSDYSKYMVKCFSEPEKRAHREIQFPLDCQSAFEMGKSMAIQSMKSLPELEK